MFQPVWIVPMPGQPGYVGDWWPHLQPWPICPPTIPQQWPYHWYTPTTTKIVVTNGTQP